MYIQMFRTSAGIVVTFPYHYNDNHPRSTVNRQLFTAATVFTDRATQPAPPQERRSSVSVNARLYRMGATLSTAHQWLALPTRLPLVPNEYIRSPSSLHHGSRHILTNMMIEWDIIPFGTKDSTHVELQSMEWGLSPERMDRMGRSRSHDKRS